MRCSASVGGGAKDAELSAVFAAALRLAMRGLRFSDLVGNRTRIERFPGHRVSNPVMVDEHVSGPTAVATASAGATAIAFETFAEQHLAHAYRLASAVLGSGGDAEDAVHDAFLAAWRNWDALRNREARSRWFDAIVVNTCRNMLRRKRPWQPGAGILEMPYANGTEGISSVAERDAIEQALASLNPDQRIVVALRFYGDYTIDDIASRTGAPVGTVKSRLHHALQKLERQLQGADGGLLP